MLDVVIIRAPWPPGQALQKAGGTVGLWRGSRPGEQLCRLEAARVPRESGAVGVPALTCWEGFFHFFFLYLGHIAQPHYALTDAC